MSPRVYFEVVCEDQDEQATKISALLGALGYDAVRTFQRQQHRIERQFEELAQRLSADERATLHAMLVTDNAAEHARLVGVEERRAERREVWLLFKLNARDRLELLRRLAGVRRQRD